MRVFFVLYIGISLFSFFLSPIATAGELFITGVYQGKSLFIQNPIVKFPHIFCIYEIQVNNKSISSYLFKLSAIEIKFEGIQKFEPVMVKILYKNECRPIVLNAHVLFWHSGFSFTSINITDTTDNTLFLQWTTRGEKKDAIYTIEKMNEGKWQKIDQIHALGNFISQQYTYTLPNEAEFYKLRIQYAFAKERPHYSEEIEHITYKDLITFYPQTVSDRITFSKICDYQIIDANENALMQGTAKEVYVKKLQKGEYTLILDTQKETFYKK